MRHGLLLVAGLSLLAACGGSDSGTGPSNLSGTVTFNYSGGVSGTFTASGALPTSSSQVETSTWSAGFKDEASQQLVVEAFLQKGGGRSDIVVFAIDRLIAGSSTIDVDCDPEIDDACTGFIVIFGSSNTTGDFQFLCFLQTGQITITEISGTRVKGTFSGSGFCIDENGVQSNFTVSGGTFDVALVSNIPTT